MVLGSTSPGDMSLGDADAMYTGEASGDMSGGGLSCAGDVDGDGYDDLLIGADGEDTNDISKYEDMQSDTYKNLKTTGDNATDDDKDKARRWIHDSSVLAGILRRSTHRNPLGRNIIKRALPRTH